METAKLTTKGRMTIPKRLRELYSWDTGLAFAIIDTGQGVLLKPVRPFPPTTVDEVAGSLASGGKTRTVEEMEEEVRREFLAVFLAV